MHMAALQKAGKKQQMQAAEGQLTSAQGQVSKARRRNWRIQRSAARSTAWSPTGPTYAGETPPPGTPLLTHHGHLVGDRQGAHPAGPGGAAEARRCRYHHRAGRHRSRAARSRWSVPRSIPTAHRRGLDRGAESRWTLPSGHDGARSKWWRAQSNDAVVVPASAVLKTPEGATTVMIVKDGHAHQVAVETGVREGDRVQITKGLGGGETVIARGLRAARQDQSEDRRGARRREQATSRARAKEKD